jgi:hypothetical protein
MLEFVFTENVLLDPETQALDWRKRLKIALRIAEGNIKHLKSYPLMYADVSVCVFL